MDKTNKILKQMRQSPNSVRFDDVIKVCEGYFGTPRIRGSHHFFVTPWEGKPLVNLQEGKGGKAKGYQVKQVLNAIEKMENMQ